MHMRYTRPLHGVLHSGVACEHVLTITSFLSYSIQGCSDNAVSLDILAARNELAAGSTITMKFQLRLPHLFSDLSSSTSLQSSSTYNPSQNYLIGLRGLLTIQSFLFVFLQTFFPAAIPDSTNLTGPKYQLILRKSLGVLFWNESLIYSFIILLSARTTCLPFLGNAHKSVCSSSIFRRGLRLWLPTFAAFSLSAAAFSKFSTQYVEDFLVTTGNVSTEVPMRMRNFLVFFNSLFDLFWLTKDYGSQAANRAFPSGTLWIVNVLFQQSYTVYMTMVIVPYTRRSWRVKALITFILSAWWVQVSIIPLILEF